VNKTGKPPNRTRWVCRNPGPHNGDFFMRNGVLMYEPRDGGGVVRSYTSTAFLRSRPETYIEIPPEGDAVGEPPLNGTRWLRHNPDPLATDYFLLDGQVWVQFRQGRPAELAAGTTVNQLRSLPNDFLEIPPRKLDHYDQLLVWAERTFTRLDVNTLDRLSESIYAHGAAVAQSADADGETRIRAALCEIGFWTVFHSMKGVAE